MITREQVLNRLQPAITQRVPVTNYGIAIAYMQCIFNRAVYRIRNRSICVSVMIFIKVRLIIPQMYYRRVKGLHI